MKSKKWAFLILVGLIAPSAVMSVDYVDVTDTTKHKVRDKMRKTEDQISELERKLVDVIVGMRNAKHPQKEPGSVPSKRDVFSLILKKVDRFFIETVAFEQQFKSDIREYIEAYIKLYPDAWDDNLKELFESSRISIFLKSLAIQKAAKEVFKEFPYDYFALRTLKFENNYCNFIRNVKSIENLSLSKENAEFNNLMQEMPSSITAVKNITDYKLTLKVEESASIINSNGNPSYKIYANRDESENSNEKKSFLELKSEWDKKIDGEEEKYRKFIEFFLFTEKKYSEPFCLMNKTIFGHIDNILEYIKENQL